MAATPSSAPPAALNPPAPQAAATPATPAPHGPDSPGGPGGPTRAADLAALLGEDGRRPLWRRLTPWLLGALVAAAAAAAWWWPVAGGGAQAVPRYNTEPIARGSLTQTVTANGTLAPTRSVAIGSELSGTVAQVLVDVNDRVRKGQVLVVLDTAKLRDQITRSRATLASAQAKLASARATVSESEGNLKRLQEVQRLSAGRVPAQSDLASAEATLARARADQLAAEAAVADARAALSTDETNLAKASIRSPIDGVVLARSVEPGNAVAASLQAVTLLTLAEDLHRMLLNVSIDEADVGAVQPGQPARFTVAAYAGRNFPARITRVAFGSTITDNVVTYTTQMTVDNPDQALRPGMTATASITAREHKDVLTVPASALRFTPTQRPGAEGAGGPPAGGASAPGAGSGSVLSKLMPRPPQPTATRREGGAGGSGARAAVGAGGERRIWVLKDGQPQPLTVTVGLSDGRRTEVSGPGVAEGLAVITDQRSTSATSAR